MTLAREEVIAALNNQETGKIPISFWRHFAVDEFTNVFQEPAVLQTNLGGHQKYYNAVDVDFAKTMLDGYFAYPFRGVDDPRSLTNLQRLRPLNQDDPWITGQVELAQQQQQIAGKRPTFITMFSPMLLFKWALIKHYAEPLLLADQRFTDLYEQDPSLVLQVLEVIADDQIKVVQAIMANTTVDGIYYSTQSIQDSRLRDDTQFFKQVMEPIDLKVQEGINQVSRLNILHICGFDGATNHLEWFTNYPLQVVNWATGIDGYSLGEGKKLFGDRPVMGGFDNSTTGILYRGTKEQMQTEVKRLIDEAGHRGIILGADCTVPRDISYERLNWAIEAAHQG